LEGALIGSPEVLIDSDLENDGFIDHLSGLKPQGDVQDQVLAESSSGGAPLIEVSKNGIDHLDDSKGWRGLFTDNRTMGNLKFFHLKRKVIKPTSILLIQLWRNASHGGSPVW
jgi:hypothetical protein